MPEATPAAPPPPAAATAKPAAKPVPVAPFAKPPAAATTKPVDADGRVTEAAGEEDVDPKDLWKRFSKGRTIKHAGKEKALEEFDPDEVPEMLRRGYGASQLVAEANKAKAEAEKVLAYKKAIAEGDDDAALEAIMEIGGERGLRLLDRLRGEMAKQQEESAGLSDKERAALERAQAAEQRAAQLEREQQKRAKDDEQKQAQRDEAQTKQEGLVKVGELMKGLKGFPKEKADLLLPYIARAWREAIETGAELGRDVPSEAVIKRAEALFRGSTQDFYGKLSPAEQYEFLGEEAVVKLSAELVRRRKSTPVAAKPAQPPASKPAESSKVELGDPRYLMR